MKPHETLDRAADLIDQYGLCKGQMYDGRSHCAIGALLEVGNCIDGMVAAGYMARAVGSEVAYWNDRPSRTAQEVSAAMRATAAVLRAQEANVPFLEMACV